MDRADEKPTVPTDQGSPLAADDLRRQVAGWFSRSALAAMLGPGPGHAEQLGLDWLAKAGKRWRPLLTACVFQGLRPEAAAVLPSELQLIAVAVECFHKASLIHDDIEDNDPLRYGEQTLCHEFGVAIALNVGDLLLGQGYYLLARSGLSAAHKVRLLDVAAACHRRLCIGQGEELTWMRDPQPLTPEHVLGIFRHKTAPAFNVALQGGAILADADEKLRAKLVKYSESLGVAYQIGDDLNDVFGPHANDLHALRPSLLLALAYEHGRPADRRCLDSFCRHGTHLGLVPPEVAHVVHQTNVRQRAAELLAFYCRQADEALDSLSPPRLKNLLRCVNGSILQPTDPHALDPAWHCVSD